MCTHESQELVQGKSLGFSLHRAPTLINEVYTYIKSGTFVPGLSLLQQAREVAHHINRRWQYEEGKRGERQEQGYFLSLSRTFDNAEVLVCVILSLCNFWFTVLSSSVCIHILWPMHLAVYVLTIFIIMNIYAEQRIHT